MKSYAVASVLLALIQIFILYLLENDERFQFGFGGSMGWLPDDPSTCTPIHTDLMKQRIVCIPKCSPEVNTLQDLVVDPSEKINISMPNYDEVGIIEYYKYHVDFPEEDISLALTARLSNDIDRARKDAKPKGEPAIPDKDFLQPRPITERLLRRIVAKLLRAGVLDPSKNILTTGSWIGDNALPWAMMLEKMRPGNPGKVIGIDPSEKFIYDMVDLANVNGVGNLCGHVGVSSSKVASVGTIGMSTEHVGVFTKDEFNADPKWKKRTSSRSWANVKKLNAAPLDAFSLTDLSLLHLDVEGHEGDVLEGARATIESSRPVIITEGSDSWPDPSDEKDKRVLKILTELRYDYADTIPEHCGLGKNVRNRIWWPDKKTRDAAMAALGGELERITVSWMSKELPDIESHTALRHLRNSH